MSESASEGYRPYQFGCRNQLFRFLEFVKEAIKRLQGIQGGSTPQLCQLVSIKLQGRVLGRPVLSG